MLLVRIERYMRLTRTPPARFGRLAANDPNFVFDMRDGRVPRSPLVARINAWLDVAERDHADAQAQAQALALPGGAGR